MLYHGTVSNHYFIVLFALMVFAQIRALQMVKTRNDPVAAVYAPVVNAPAPARKRAAKPPQATDAAPAVLTKIDPEIDPEYSQAARAAQVSGMVVLQLVVTAEGKPAQIKLIKSAGYGLDEQSVKAVKQWTFIPGIRHGKPTPMYATVEVTFKLCCPIR